MITPKQRSNLRAIANTLEPVLQIGKEGITDGTLVQANALFEAREIFKIKVLNNCDVPPKDIAQELENECKCDVVQVIGSKITVYRRSKRNNIKHIELD